MLFPTELMSNVALATMFIPVAIANAIRLERAPLLLPIPMVMAAGCAFMMSISSTPNAIALSSGHIKIIQMERTGLILNLLSVLILLISAFTITKSVFG